jgi:hypothetical protein
MPVDSEPPVAVSPSRVPKLALGAVTLNWTSEQAALEAGLPVGRQLRDGFADGIARIGGHAVVGGTLDGSGSAAEWAVWIGEVRR